MQPTPPVRSVISEWTVTLLFLLFGTTTLVQGYVIPTGSMEDNLLVGDHVLVDKLIYAPPGSLAGHFLPYREPRRGDVIVFRYPPNIKETYVKRCIGLPGDRVRIADKALYLNGRKLDEPYVFHKSEFLEPYRDNFPAEPNVPLPPGGVAMLRDHVENGEVVVPAGQYLALGDNRDNSWDSRFWGFVPRENIIGSPVLVYWSYDAPTEELMDYNFTHMFDLARNFFVKTRWERTLKLVRSRPVN